MNIRIYGTLGFLILSSFLAAPGEPAAPTAPPSKPVTLTLWHWETPPARVKGMEKLFARFKTETGISVEQVPINFPDYQTKLFAAMSTNTLPDFVFINPPSLPLLLQSKAIISAEDLFKRLDNKFKFASAMSAPYRVNGVQYAIPVFGLFWPLTYRADLYKNAGLKPPETWTDLRAAAEKLTLDTNGDGVPDVYGMCLPVSSNGNYGSQVVWAFLRSNKGDVVQVEKGKETIVFNSPQNIKTYAFLSDLAKFSPPGKENLDWAATELLIKSGKCATVMYTAAWIGELSQNNPDLLAKYSMTHMPVADGGQVVHTGYPRALALTTTARQHMDAVTKFLEWFYEPKNNAEFLYVEPVLFVPVTEATAKSDAFLSLPLIAANQRFVTALTDAGKTVQVIGFTGTESAPHASQIENSFTLGKVLQKIVLEGMSPQQAVAWGAEQYQVIISK
jgi:multiple sugar transport system substrate-binding protein